jgi:hypothetical protein
LSQLRFSGCDEVRGIHLVVAEELEYVTMEAVGARLGDGIHHRAAELSVLRVEAVRNQTKFLNRIEIRNQTGTQISPFADVAPVHQKGVGCLALAIY